MAFWSAEDFSGELVSAVEEFEHLWDGWFVSHGEFYVCSAVDVVLNESDAGHYSVDFLGGFEGDARKLERELIELGSFLLSNCSSFDLRLIVQSEDYRERKVYSLRSVKGGDAELLIERSVLEIEKTVPVKRA